MTDASDLELLERWRAGDLRAGDRLVTRQFARVRGYFVNKLPYEHEDLVQETFARLVQARDNFRGKASFRTYVIAIAKLVLVDHLRERYREPQLWTVHSSIADLSGRRPSSVMAEREEHRLLLDSLRRIPIDDQDLLELYYWQDLTGRELAELFELAESTVRSRIRAALERLRRAYLELRRRPHERELELEQLESWLTELRYVIGRGVV